MKTIKYSNGTYRTCCTPVSLLARRVPSFVFYCRFLKIAFRASRMAKRGQYGDVEWSDSSFDVMQALERVGVCFEITGIEQVQQLKEACVFVANHVSMLETMILPIIIQPIKKVTFVVKQGLLEYPVFKHVMRSRDPVAVSRENPREDLKTVLNGGVERLQAGRSIIIFPQTTRTTSFDPAQFNTIGIKLAQKAQVPVVPIALLTNAWSNGKYVKDFGSIDPSKTVYFAFGAPLRIQGRGNAEHEMVVEFICSKLQEWDQNREMLSKQPDQSLITS